MKLKIAHLTKSYGSQTVLKDLNLEVDGVTAVGILGPSGCGKSTLLRQLAGIEVPQQGEIFVNGLSPITQTRQFQEGMGYVFQKHNLFPHLTIFENIMLILEKVKGQDKTTATARTQAVLETMHITSVAHKRPHEVSGGQAQRASIARALATDPQLLCLDEPTAALDPILTREVLRAVRELKDTGRDFFFVTHEMDFLRSFADYILFLEDGNLVEHGPVERLKRPQTPELQAFLSLEEGI